MKQLILVLSFLFFNYTFSQDIMGTWKVKEIIEKDGTEEMKKQAKEVFQDSEFTFLKENRFIFFNSSKSRAALEFMKLFSGASWILDSKNQVIKIGSKMDDYSIASILYKEIDGIMYFQLQEFDYIFKMEKVVKE